MTEQLKQRVSDAIRKITGCPDITNAGASLTAEIVAALDAAPSEQTREQELLKALQAICAAQKDGSSTKLDAAIYVARATIAGETAPKSLLRAPIAATNPLPKGCYCELGKCMAPQPNWCRDAAKRDGKPTAASAVRQDEQSKPIASYCSGSTRLCACLRAKLDPVQCESIGRDEQSRTDQEWLRRAEQARAEGFVSDQEVKALLDKQSKTAEPFQGCTFGSATSANGANLTISAKTAEPADSAQAFERFYFDHGLWHDRATGRHLYTQDQYDQEKQAAFKDGYDKRNEELALAAQNAPAQPVPEAEKSVPTWQEAERISDVHEVNMALENFAHDSTADNAAGLVLAVLIAAAPQGEQQ